MDRILAIDDAGIEAVTAAITAGMGDAELLELLASKAVEPPDGLITAESEHNFTLRNLPMDMNDGRAVYAAKFAAAVAMPYVRSRRPSLGKRSVLNLIPYNRGSGDGTARAIEREARVMQANWGAYRDTPKFDPSRQVIRRNRLRVAKHYGEWDIRKSSGLRLAEGLH